MKYLHLLLWVVAPCVVALRPTVGRRQVIGGAAAALVVAKPPASSAEVPVDPFNSMCFGFGCAQAQGVDSEGAPAPLDEESIPWRDVLKMIDEKKIQRVEFNDVSMAKAWAITESGRIRIGQGYPVDDGKSWSSPLFVTRTLANNQIPYGYVAGLKRRSSAP